MIRGDGTNPRFATRAARTSVRAASFVLAAAIAAGGALSCAGPAKLARQSEEALRAGDVDRAYEKARDAVEKAPDHEPARAALSAAVDRKAARLKESARALAAAGDTAAAGAACLELEAFRSEAAEYRIVPAPDEDFDRDAARIRHAAAGRLVRSAEEAMAEGRARNAYDQLEIARSLEVAYPGLDERQREAYAEALHRIAILPVSNQTEARGLGMEVTDLVYREAADRVRQRNFPFTVILPRTEVFSRITLAEANDLDRSDALEIARAVDADLVVRGRVYALSTESRRDTWEGSIFRRVADRDSAGRGVDRYDEIPIEVTGMTRRVTLRFEFEIRETDGGTTLVRHDEPLSAAARVTYTSYRPEGDCDDYVLASPALKRRDSSAASGRERAWKEHCGSWELPAYLDTIRKGSRRSYQASMRSEFHADTESRPVILGELPPAEDLAAVAVRRSWEPVVEALRRLER